MKSALPQQAPTPIKMKSVTLLNKQEKLFTNNIERSGAARRKERSDDFPFAFGFRAAQSLALFYSKGPFQ